MSLWTASDAVAATGGTTQGDWAATGVSIDTRTLVAGDMFVALRAARDGHDFVVQALGNGASVALVDHRPDDVAQDAPLLIVPDVLIALEQLGQAARQRTNARVIAVTGSVGKTSTKEMLRDVLAQQGATHASVASYNNHWGVPLTLARMPRDTQYALIEIGMNHPGEIAPLSRLAQPHVALVTTVGPAHLEAFGHVDKIALEKASVIDGLSAHGAAIFNADIETAPVLAKYAAEKNVPVRWFGQTAPTMSDLVVAQNENGLTVSVKIDDNALSFDLKTQGEHFAMNAIGALMAIDAAGGDMDQAARDLSLWQPVQGRGARSVIKTPSGEIDLIDDAYNSNPASLRASLAVLAQSRQGRRVACLGDMRELGPQEAHIHSEISQWPELTKIDQIHTVGPLMRHLFDALPADKRGQHFDTAKDLAQAIPTIIQARDSVLLKASLSIGMACAVDAIRNLGQGGPKA